MLNKRGTKVWKRGQDATDERAPFAVKATIEIPVPPSEVADILLTRDYDVIRRFNPTIVDGADLEDMAARCVVPPASGGFGARVQRQRVLSRGHADAEP